MKKVESIKPTGELAELIEDIKKDLLLKDLSARLPYGVKCNVTEAYWHGAKNVPIEPTIKVFTAFDYDQYACGKYYQVGVSQSCIISVKPYLRPMSSMTEMEKKSITEGLYSMYNDNDSFESYGVEIMRINPRDGDTYNTNYSAIDLLNEHMLDYRGLIKEGIALEAPKGMYNFEEED